MSELKWSYLIVHHTGAEEKDAAQVRNYHLSLGWRDVGYHFLIEREGRVVPGRSLALPGAHCTASGMNTKGIGIALLGNLNNHPPLAAQEKTLLNLLRELKERFSIPVAQVLGHQEVPGAATACPGRYLAMTSLRATLSSGQGNIGSVNSANEQIFRVQVGAYRERQNAERMAALLKKAGFPVVILGGTSSCSP